MGAADNMPSLPEDPAALRALLLATLEQRDAAMAERDALAARNEQLHHLLLKLKGSVAKFAASRKWPR